MNIELSISTSIAPDNMPILKRYPPETSIKGLKEKFYRITGIEPKYQDLKFSSEPDFNDPDSLDSPENDEVKLADLCPVNKMNVRIYDLDPNQTISSLLNANPDEAAESLPIMTKDEYESRNNTFVKWKQENPALFTKNMDYPEVGDRCKIGNGDGRRGTVRYIGEIPEKTGIWIGVELDDPLGKHTGKGLFECDTNHGSFFRRKNLLIGDYPKLNLEDVDEL